MIQTECFKQLIDFPTRNNNILDLILINNPLLSHIIVTNSFEYNNHISDHISIIYKLVLHLSNSLTDIECLKNI